MENWQSELVDPTGVHVQLDQAIVACKTLQLCSLAHVSVLIKDSVLPTNCEILQVRRSGKSLWVHTVKIVVRLADGTTAEYFKKGAFGHVGANMMKGAFAAEQALYAYIPEQVPRPVGWGSYVDNPDIHFYICEFVDISDDVPSAIDWAAAVSRLHLSSMGKSPTGQFGFHFTTDLANVPVDNTWNASWEQFWRQQMRGLFDQDDLINGSEQELTPLKTTFLKKVIPRYLRPLKSGGRSIEPCLIHSDLWPGSIKLKISSTGLCMFDSCAYWGHNEADLGICQNPRYRLGPPCITEYLKRVPAAEPAADFEGRNAVYAMKYHELLSVMYRNDRRFRDTLINELKAAVAGLDTDGVAALVPVRPRISTPKG